MRKCLLSGFTLLCALSSIPLEVTAADVLTPGFLKFEAFANITGTPVDNLTADPRYPNQPSETLYMTSFDTRTVYPDDSHDNFGARISGFIIPTVSGDYEFFLRSDDASQLFLSTDETAASAVMIAEETGCCGAFEETGSPETSTPISLVAGRRYYVYAIYKEGGGGDYCQVAWRRAGDTTAAASLRPIPGAFLAANLPAQGNVAITRQPSNITSPANEKVTLSLDVTNSHGPLVIQWQKNGTNVAGLEGPSIALGPLALTDSGAKYRAVVSIPGAVATSSEATLTVTADNMPPKLSSVRGSVTFDTLTVTFSEPVTAASAGVAANYTLDGGVTVLSAAVTNSTTVKLTTTRQAADTLYTLNIRNIIDTANNPSAPDTKISFRTFVYEKGGLKFESWLGIGGNAVQTLLDDPRYPESPDETGYVTSFNSRDVYGDDTHANYGARMSGWIAPTESGQYEFFIRSDDNSQLFLSTDDNPTNMVMIAEETGCCGPFEESGAPETSAPIALVAGRRYYIQALWKEGGGGDYCHVAWRKVGDPTQALVLPILPGTFLETVTESGGTFVPPQATITSPSPGGGFAIGAPVPLTVAPVAMSGKTIARVEYFLAARKIGEVTQSPYTLTISNLTEDVYTMYVKVSDSAGLSTTTAPVTFSVGNPRIRTVLFAINDTTTWRYDRSGADLGTEWRERNFDDSSWPPGKALIADEGTTTVEPIRTRISRFNDAGEYVRTFYFRTRFNFSGSTEGARLQLRHVIDDGAVFYLNGQEVHRFGIGAGVDVNFQTDAAGHENAYEGPYNISVTNLLSGDNVFAVEVHQSGGSSSDMVFGAELVVTVPAIQQPLKFTTISKSGTTLRVEWTGNGRLQEAPAVTGPWTDVTNATTPYTPTIAGSARFFRLRQ